MGGCLKDRYYTIKEDAQIEIIINKSRFIGTAIFVENEEKAIESLQTMRNKYPDATHNCYGYVTGLDVETKRFSDDGEPGGTAGMPILQVIEQRDIKNVLVVVTRYFGGIKLGAGGLVRAYTRATAEALDKAGVVCMQLCHKGILSMDYSNLGIIEYYLNTHGIPVLDKDYKEKVSFTVITNDAWDDFKSTMTDLCSGNIKCHYLEDTFYPWDL
jgi:uncharacterized YigZ family protein